jgi:alkanesulfonate monooxygenase SsuD/methylene tetrahydromethanopterin reductase-like flavin-dependent oxidoreductase (luciferase family)
MDVSPQPGIALLAGAGLEVTAIPALSAAAEAAGFRDIHFVESEYDSIALCQAALANTSTAHVGTCIMRAYTRHPMLLAEGAAALDALSGSRFEIGLGVGPTPREPDDGLRWGMPWKRAVRRMDEYLSILQLALTGDVVSFSGEFYSVDGVQMTWSPPSGHVPIWLAAGGPLMARLAGRRADGVLLHWANQPLTEHFRSEARAGSLSAGRNGEVRVGNPLMTCVDDDREAARQAMRTYVVGWYLAIPRYLRLLADAGWRDVANELARLEIPRMWGATPHEILANPKAAAGVALLPDELLDQFTLAGSPDECRERLDQFVEWGVDAPMVNPFPANDDWLDGCRTAIAAFASKEG